MTVYGIIARETVAGADFREFVKLFVDVNNLSAGVCLGKAMHDLIQHVALPHPPLTDQNFHDLLLNKGLDPVEIDFSFNKVGELHKIRDDRLKNLK